MSVTSSIKQVFLLALFKIDPKIQAKVHLKSLSDPLCILSKIGIRVSYKLFVPSVTFFYVCLNTRKGRQKNNEKNPNMKCLFKSKGK